MAARGPHMVYVFPVPLWYESTSKGVSSSLQQAGTDKTTDRKSQYLAVADEGGVESGEGAVDHGHTHQMERILLPITNSPSTTELVS